MTDKPKPKSTNMPRTTWLLAFRLSLGTLALVAIATQLSVHIQYSFSVVNFFSFFTNLSNLLAAIVLLSGAFQLMAHRRPTARSDWFRCAAVSQMAVVGIVFAILLHDVDLGSLRPWVNTVLHTVMPIAVVLEWWWIPPQNKLNHQQLLQVLIFPVMYVTYTLIRGAATGWYPYPFLNPENAGGYGGVVAYAVAIAAVCYLVSWMLFKIANMRNKTAKS